MQWDDSPNAGFCDAQTTPWMRVLDTYREINVANQVGREGSVFEFWKNAIRFRKQHKDLLVYGRFQVIDQHEDLLVFVKEAADGKVSLTVANLSDQPREWTLPPSLPRVNPWNLALATCNAQELQQSQLAAFEGRVYVSGSP
jgi:alpha-glucosidase